MNLTKIAVKRPLTAIMVFCIVIVFGVMGYTKMAVELTPDMSIPVFSVRTSWSGAGPKDVEEQVTEIVENAVSALNGVDSVISRSSEGSSMVMVQFEYGTDMTEAITDARNRIERIQGQLPDDADKPTVSEIDMDARPIGEFVITSDLDRVAVMNYAEDIVQPELEQVPGVNSVDIQGGVTGEVTVTADPTMLERYGITLSTISTALRSANGTTPYGSITEGEDKVTLRSTEKITSLDQIKQLPVKISTGKTIHLDKICDATYGYADQESIYRYNGKDSLLLNINKKQSANTVAIMKGVNEVLDNLNRENKDYSIKLISDESEEINTSMNNVWFTLGMSSIIALLIILLFLKDIKASIIVATAIPLSIIGAIAGLYLAGQSLNLITVGGLVLGVGMVVDNSIVVIENIFKNRQEENLEIHESAVVGTATVSNAILASTLTSVAVFVPIFFAEGVASIMFGALAQSIIFSLLFSIFVAVTMVPSLFAKFSTGKKHKELIEKPSPIFDKVKDGYERLSKFTLSHKLIVLIASILILVISFMSFSSIGMDLMPSSDDGSVSITMELPEGLDLEASDYYLSMAEKKLLTLKELDTMTSSLNSSSGRQNRASISVNLVDEKERTKTTSKIADEIKVLLATVPDCKITVSANRSMAGPGGGGSGYSIRLAGPDLDVLMTISEQFMDKMKGIKGLENISSDFTDADQEAQIKIDKEKAAEWGVETQTVSSILRMSIAGSTVTTAEIDEDTVDVKLKLADEKIKSRNDILRLKVKSSSGEDIPIGAFASIVMEDSPKTLSKTDGDYSITISADLRNLDAGTAQRSVMAAVSGIQLPKDYQINAGSRMRMMNDSFKSLAQALCFSIILVYMVMVAQFESFKKPFIIMFAIPFAFVGVIWSLILTHASLSISAFIGIILLVGIVVNNGIVLIDYIEQLRQKHQMDLKDAIAHGAAARLRPVLMTTLTTVLALLPTALGIGEGSETMQPMGIVIFGGLSISTFVTLLLIPVIYMIFELYEEKKENRKKIKEAKKEGIDVY